tara:strand:- start:253 stop:408 length:156 start_codon:yes stop_codon:yes gene_type:complete
MPNSAMALPLEKRKKTGKSAHWALFFGHDFRRYVAVGRPPMGYSPDEVDHG